MKKSYKKIIPIILLPIFLLIIFAPLSVAHAETGPELLNKAAGAINFASDPMGYANSSLIEFFGQFLAFMAQLFDWAIHIQNFEDVKVVKDVWTIIRDFVNMFFILILIIIAFGTIFNIDKYSARTPGVISRFIIVAVLINFSLVIGVLIINISDSVALMFLNSMGNDITGNIANGLGLQDIIAKDPSSFNVAAAQNSGFGTMIAAFATNSLFLLIMIVILFFVFSAAAIFTLVRIPYLWGLLIVSPAIWALAIFPSTRSVWTKWWGQFMGWVLFLPTYLSVVFVVLAVLNSKQSITVALGSAQAPSSFGAFIVQNLFFYVLVIMALIYGLKMSLSLGHIAGTSAGNMMSSIDNKVTGYAKKGAKEAGGYLAAPVTDRYQGLKQGAGAWWNKKMTQPRQNKQNLRKARVASKWGDEKALNNEFSKQAEERFKNIKGDFDSGKITMEDAKKKMAGTKASDVEGFAYRRFLAENGELSSDELLTSVGHLKNMGPEAAGKLAEAVKAGGFKDIKPEDMIAMANGTGAFTDFKDSLPMRRVFASAIKGNKKALGKIDYDQLDGVIQTLSPNDRKDFMDQVAKVRPDLVGEYNRKRGEKEIAKMEAEGATADAIKEKQDKVGKIEYNTMKKAVSRTDDLAEMPVDVWERDDLKNILSDKLSDANLSSKAMEDYIETVTKKILESEDSDKKLAIFNKIATDAKKDRSARASTGGAPTAGGDTDDDTPSLILDKSGRPYKKSTVSYRENNIPRIDLADLEDESTDNILDLRNISDETAE